MCVHTYMGVRTPTHVHVCVCVGPERGGEEGLRTIDIMIVCPTYRRFNNNDLRNILGIVNLTLNLQT